MRVSAITGLLFGGLLFATNPTKDDYATWIKEQAVSESHDTFGKLVIAAVGGALVRAATTREDLLFLSIYKTDLGNGAKFAALGILHHFIPLQNMGQTEPQHVWVPGAPSPNYPNIISAQAEGRWLPADGYAWINDPPVPGDMRVKWVPGRFSTIHPHVVAAQTEGRWLPENGYMWVTNPPVSGDFRVKPIGLGQPLVASHCNAKPYLCTLFGLIMSQQHYPETARAEHIEGRVVVLFWLDESGNLIRQQLYKSSGDTELDNEALAAIKRAAPFPPPPFDSPHGFVAQMEFPPK